MKRTRFLCLSILLLSLPACRPALMLKPAPILVAAKSPDQTRQVIITALKNRGWMLSKDSPGEIVATLHSRGHMARIKIAYSDETIEVSYVDSDNLEHEIRPSGEEVIHRNYNKWVRILIREITVAMTYAAS